MRRYCYRSRDAVVMPDGEKCPECGANTHPAYADVSEVACLERSDIEQGIASARRGEIVDLGDFTQFANDTEEK